MKYDVRRRRGGRRIIKKIGREYKIILEGWREAELEKKTEKEFDKKNAAYFKKRKETAMKRRSVIAERRSSGDLKPAKVGGGDLKSRLAIWNKRVGDYEEKQKTNNII